MRRLLVPIFALALSSATARAQDPGDWPMLGHDVARSGATPTEVRPPFERKWYRAFPEEGLMAGVQPVVAAGRLFIGTLRGILHCIDAESGKDQWTYQAGGPILHACEAGHQRVFFTCADAKVYCLSADDGTLRWTFQTGAALWNAPAHDGTDLLVGGRDGKLYALKATTGQVQWAANVGGPILSSPAVDEQRRRVYVGAEDMRVYAVDRDTGRQLWRTDKLPGVSFRGYHPVVAADGSVLITTQPCAGGDAIQQVVLDMAKEVFGDFASWRHNKDDNTRLRERNFKLMEDPASYTKQLDYLRKRLSDEPAYQTFFMLDPETGRKKFVAPLVYAESMNGTGAPPVVTPDGKVIVKYSALLRSRYEHYSPFLNVGYLDTATGHIAPIMDQSRTYGWHDSLLLVHDEQSQLSVGGRVLFNTHQDNVNGLDLDTLRGYAQPMCQNVHEAPAGAAVGIWATYLAGKELPVGWEWFARGTAVCGGGSAIDVPIVIAGDSFYYLPTHEINSGCALVAYRMRANGTASEKTPPPKGTLSAEQWEAVHKSGKWDWDTLASPRLDLTLKALPQPPPGTHQRPLLEQARAAVAAIPDKELDAVLHTLPEIRASPHAPEDLTARLDAAVAELISQPWQPMLFPAGKAPAEAYRFFTDSGETLYTLALAFPHLSADRQHEVKEFVKGLRSTRYDPRVGSVRTAYDPAPDKLLHIVEGVAPRSDTARLYQMWLWAHVTGDWEQLRAEWPALRGRIKAEPDGKEIDCGNGRIAGLIAACRIASTLNDEETQKRLLPVVRVALRERLVYESAHTRGGLIMMNESNRRAVFGRWRNLTPDVARLCRLHGTEVHAGLMDVYVDHHRPTWWLAWNVETLWGNEVPTAFPTESQEIFAARAMILSEPSDRLSSYIDLPWCRGDEYYVQKLALTLGNAGRSLW